MTDEYHSARPSEGELQNRWERLQALMGRDGLDGALFFQNADLLYLCGTTQAEAVFLPSRGKPLVLAHPPLDRVKSETDWAEVVLMPSWSGLQALLKASCLDELVRLGLELDVLPVSFYDRLSRETLAGLRTVDVSSLMRQVRSIKTDFEVSQMSAAAAMMDSVFQAVPDILTEGLTELELEGRLLGLARTKGHQGLIRSRGFNMEMFIGHVLSGSSGLVPAKVSSPTGGTGVDPGFGQGAGPRAIGPGELVSVDLCGTHGGYIIDQTRNYYTGSVPDTVQRAYDRLLDLVEALKAVLRPGFRTGEVYDRAFQLAGRLEVLDGFMGLGSSRCPFVGHGVGLELDEWPVLGRGTNTLLVAGMTFALEPRIFLPGVGVVGLEDTYLLTPEGPRSLTITDRDLKTIVFR